MPKREPLEEAHSMARRLLSGMETSLRDRFIVREHPSPSVRRILGAFDPQIEFERQVQAHGPRRVRRALEDELLKRAARR